LACFYLKRNLIMPNWCSNEITISGTTQELKRFLTDCGYFDGHQFSFQRLKPMPEELKNIDHYYVDGGERYERKIGEGETQILTEQEVKNLKSKYGAAHWYDWNINNWGAKWDVGGDANWSCTSDEFLKCTLDDEYTDIYVSFDTAWSPPEELYKTLTSEYKLDFDWFYKEPGMRFAGWMGSNG